jgi:hypothetical protein
MTSKIILTKDHVNGDPRNYGVVKYMKRMPGGYQGRSASGAKTFVPNEQVQEIREVA